uniref:Uncharacterized protein n=1 Tax=Knipowitschia caucasica TaxID=637954 RepID=A0AAV2KMZ8_KNICA
MSRVCPGLSRVCPRLNPILSDLHNKQRLFCLHVSAWRASIQGWGEAVVSGCVSSSVLRATPTGSCRERAYTAKARSRGPSCARSAVSYPSAREREEPVVPGNAVSLTSICGCFDVQAQDGTV